MQFIRVALAVVCLAMSSSMIAQVVDRYTVVIETPVTAERTVTIAQPASNAKRFELEQISGQITNSGGAIRMERDCTTVTTTSAIVPTAINSDTPNSSGPTVRVYDASAATGCVKLSPSWQLPPGALLPVPGAGTYKQLSGVTKNINVRVTPLDGGALNGTLRMQLIFRESR